VASVWDNCLSNNVDIARVVAETRKGPPSCSVLQLVAPGGLALGARAVSCGAAIETISGAHVERSHNHNCITSFLHVTLVEKSNP
jgi:hypothetical protein